MLQKYDLIHLLITKGPTGHLQCYTKHKNYHKTVTHNAKY